ncbi:MAG: MFS transporter [Armatimonadetes bacterium]|nr:MFS transporter [Armatimonadota bacterium]
MGSALDAALQPLLGRVTDSLPERRNLVWFALASLLYGAGAALFGGDLWNGFLKQTGFSMTEIGVLAAVTGGAGSAGLILFMGLADRIRRRVRTYSWCILAAAAAPALVVALALAPRSLLPLRPLLALLMVVGVGQALVMSIPIMLDYPIIARGVSVGVRGRLFGITTTAYGILGIGIGWLSASVLRDVAYPQGYAWCFLAASGVIALRAAAFSRVRELPELAVDGASRSALPFAAIVDVLKLKEFQWLAGPHVARGLAVSAAGFALPVGLEHLGLPEHFPGYAASATTAATVLGGIAVGLIADRLGPSWTTFLGDLLYALGMATVVLFHNPIAFIALYLLLHFGRNIEDNAVPLGAINLVPAEHLGAFSAARLMILTGSTALSAPLFGYLFDHHSPTLVFALAAGMKLLTGVWFWWVFRLKRPAPAQATNMQSP